MPTKYLIVPAAISDADLTQLQQAHSPDAVFLGIPRKFVGVYTEGDLPVVFVEGQETLDEVKARLTKAIDETCENRITEDSFEWPPASGNLFSLSHNAQTKWLGMATAAMLNGFDFVNDPPKVRTKDDLVEITLTSANEVYGAYGAAMTVVRTHLNTNRLAKGEVLGAADEAEAMAIYNAYMGNA